VHFGAVPLAEVILICQWGTNYADECSSDSKGEAHHPRSWPHQARGTTDKNARFAAAVALGTETSKVG